MRREKDVFETLTDEELLEQVLKNPADTSAHHQAAFLVNLRIAQRQSKFNLIVTVATVVMAIQAAATLIQIILGK